jgi:hypothetical protein
LPKRAVAHDCDLIAALGISTASFYLRKARGEFQCFELDTPHGSRRTEYSTHQLAEWFLTGRRPTRFFSAARRAQTKRSGRPRKLRSIT